MNKYHTYNMRKYSLPYLRQWTGEMIAIVVHQMITIATKLIANLLDKPTDLVLGEIGTTDLNALPEAKLLA